MDFKSLLKVLQENRLTVYGAGYVARSLYRALERLDLAKNVDAVVVSHAEIQTTFFGHPVQPYMDTATEGTLVLLAVHDALKDSIRLKTKDKGIWIYPYLCDLLYDPPLCLERVPLRSLLVKQDRNDNWLTVRYAAIRGLKTGDEALLRLYLSCQRLHCSPETAQKRLDSLRSLLLDMEQHGFCADRPIRIDENGRIIDGLHRIAAAAWLGLAELPCAVYRASPLYDELLTEQNRLPYAYLDRLGMKAETAALRPIEKELFGE